MKKQYNHYKVGEIVEFWCGQKTLIVSVEEENEKYGWYLGYSLKKKTISRYHLTKGYYKIHE